MRKNRFIVANKPMMANKDLVISEYLSVFVYAVEKIFGNENDS